MLAESERLSHALLNAVSHELRTPIAAIETAASGWHPGLDPAVQNALVAEIREATARLSRLVANLLDMARLESGHVKPRVDWCDMNDIVNAALKRVVSELANRGVSVKLPPSFPLVRVDSRLIEQALVNLLLNAAMHTPAGTPVEVSAAIEEQKVAITVADRGPGLPAEALPRIFDKFYRAPGAAAGGTGLGLSIVKGFVEAHGGHVRAANRPAGGAAFTIVLPLQEPPIP
ncbi:MAG: ATP-binding protein [Kiritimatiellaeota bacterium]|nr:ATP-binding protein [Kiritimatiellota bacterium]